MGTGVGVDGKELRNLLLGKVDKSELESLIALKSNKSDTEQAVKALDITHK